VCGIIIHHVWKNMSGEPAKHQRNTQAMQTSSTSTTLTVLGSAPVWAGWQGASLQGGTVQAEVSCCLSRSTVPHVSRHLPPARTHTPMMMGATHADQQLHGMEQTTLMLAGTGWLRKAMGLVYAYVEGLVFWRGLGSTHATPTQHGAYSPCPSHLTSISSVTLATSWWGSVSSPSRSSWEQKPGQVQCVSHQTDSQEAQSKEEV
jgi:hypothetical protein